MSNPKKIEQLDEATVLQDNDLLFASVRNDARAMYVSKKVTLKDIADYVKTGMEPVVSSFGGYEMLDTSEDGDGIYDASTIQSYVSDSSKNYLWRLKVGINGVYDVDVPFEKTLGKDCAIWIDDYYDTTEVYLNNIRLYNINYLRQSGMVQFYAKAGQPLKVI